MHKDLPSPEHYSGGLNESLHEKLMYSISLGLARYLYKNYGEKSCLTKLTCPNFSKSAKRILKNLITNIVNDVKPPAFET